MRAFGFLSFGHYMNAQGSQTRNSAEMIRQAVEIGVGAVFPVASDQRDLRTLGNQRGERALDEALGAAERVVALANDGQFQILVLKLAVGGCGVCLSGTRQYPPRTRNYSGRSGGAMAFGRPQC